MAIAGRAGCNVLNNQLEVVHGLLTAAQRIVSEPIRFQWKSNGKKGRRNVIAQSCLSANATLLTPLH